MPKVSRNTTSHSVELEHLDVEPWDAYYVPPGHLPMHYAGTEIVEFSPTDVPEERINVVMSNLHLSDAS